MKKTLSILLCVSALTMLAACGGRTAKSDTSEEENALETVENEGRNHSSRSESRSEKKKSSDEESLSKTQAKALDKENPWFKRDFRMELTYKQLGVTMNAVIQKTGDFVYSRAWSGGQSAEMALVIGENDFRSYKISSQSKVAQLMKTYSNEDYYTVFYKFIGENTGIMFVPMKNKESSKKDDGVVKSEVTKTEEVKDETWGGFQCEKIIRTSVSKNELGDAMKAVGALAGNSAELEATIDKMKTATATDTIWLDKESGAVVHREYVMEGAEIYKATAQTLPMPSVSSLTFSPDRSLVPASLDGYRITE